jgi:hypothetical protein
LEYHEFVVEGEKTFTNMYAGMGWFTLYNPVIPSEFILTLYNPVAGRVAESTTLYSPVAVWERNTW